MKSNIEEVGGWVESSKLVVLFEEGGIVLRLLF